MPDQPPTRKRSAAVSLGLVGVLAVSLSGCGSGSGRTVVQRCVAENDFTLATNDLCLAPTPVPGSTTSGRRYRWYYGGRISNGRVTGGSFSVPSSRSSIRTSSYTGRSSTSGSSTTASGVKTGGIGASSKSSSGS